MREPKGPIGRIADTIGGAMRRRQRDREPRVLIFDAAGLPRTVQAGTDAYAQLVETAQKMVEAAGVPPEPEPDEPEPAEEP